MRVFISLKQICCLWLLFILLPGCDSKPVVDLFKKDLKIKILYDDTGDLSVNSVVYAKNGNEERQIGSVTEIENTMEGQHIVHLDILYDYRDQISLDTMFILDEPFLKGHTRIMVASIAGDSPVLPIKSGAVVKGATFLDYNVAQAKDGVSKIIDDVTIKTKKYLEEFKKDVESIDTDEINRKLEKAIDDIAEYSKEQKDIFERETLPGLEKMVDEIIKKLDQMGDEDEKKEIEDKYEELKEGVMI